ncbi:cell division protein FtsA [Paenibacillus sp. N1-5-1-14]|uniref:cell division protein FtsA n=1 Tax=Paenibacillus radicibacter TaxID=2972488 RepID=UPI002158FF77|nr:cell division protein FtsA [Paenibacillus radicibacter]MCR8641912.1 cell division protein FtsA [Paenibacillus radicibacter]
MSGNDIIVSLDIGTSKVRAIIGEVINGSINIIGVGSAESEGIRKGAIVDIDQSVQAIRNAIDHAERMVGITISEVYVGITGNHISLQSSHGVVAVQNEDREIGEDDIERVIQAARVIALPPEREIIGVVPKQYLVDGQEGIQDPRGMIGVRLEVEATIVTGAKTSIHNLKRVVEKADLNVGGLILMSLASGQLALTKDEKNIGTVLVEVGAGSTTLAVFESGNLVATSTLPIGGEYITSDIAYGLHTQMDIADRIKLKYGCAIVEDAAADQVFKVTRMGSNVEKEFSQIDLANIIEPRAQEIFQLIRAEAHRLGHGDASGGFVLTGGAVSMPGMLTIAQVELATSVRIATPEYIGVRDPSFTSGVGIIQFVHKNIRNRHTSQNKKTVAKTVSKTTSVKKEGWFERMKNLVKDFI